MAPIHYLKRHQFIIWNKWMLTGPFAINFSNIWCKIQQFPSKKINFKKSSGKWWPSYLGVNKVCFQNKWTALDFPNVASVIIRDPHFVIKAPAVALASRILAVAMPQSWTRIYIYCVGYHAIVYTAFLLIGCLYKKTQRNIAEHHGTSCERS